MLFSKISNITLIINIEFLIQRRVVFAILRYIPNLFKVSLALSWYCSLSSMSLLVSSRSLSSFILFPYVDNWLSKISTRVRSLSSSIRLFQASLEADSVWPTSLWRTASLVSSNCSLAKASWIYWFSWYNSWVGRLKDIKAELLVLFTMVGLALASLPSGKNNFKVAIMHPWVTFREFSITSTPNWIMSPEQTSLGRDSSLPLLNLWLLTKVPLLDLVSWR